MNKLWAFWWFILSVVLPSGFAFSQSPSVDAQDLSRLRGANIVVEVKEDDLKDFHKWGGRIVRILNNSVIKKEAPYIDAELTTRIYEITRQALDIGLAVVIAPGVLHEDQDTFFAEPIYQEALVEFWKNTATEFQDDPRPVLFDLVNEPHGEGANAQWSGLAKTITDAIREIDTAHTIIVEPTGWGWPAGFEHLEPTGDDNTIYSFHFYGPMDFTAQRNMDLWPKESPHMKATEEQWRKRVYPGKIQGENWDRKLIEEYFKPAFDFAKEHDVPLWCGEFGVTRWAMGADRWLNDVIDTLEEQNVGWAYYAFREPGWNPMDLEMDPKARLEATPRKENALSRIIGENFERNPTRAF